MDLLIVLTYVALAWAVFKIFRISGNNTINVGNGRSTKYLNRIFKISVV
mgnify:CR=1 FL=1